MGTLKSSITLQDSMTEGSALEIYRQKPVWQCCQSVGFCPKSHDFLVLRFANYNMQIRHVRIFLQHGSIEHNTLQSCIGANRPGTSRTVQNF